MSDRGRLTRERLIDAASRLFAEHGYEGTSIEAVLRAAEMSRGALYHHFDSKEALFEAVLEAIEDDVDRKVVAAAAQAGDPVDELRAGCRVWIRMTADPVVRRIVLVDAPAVIGWQRWREIEEKHTLGLLKSVLGAIADQGVLPAERTELLAHMLMASINELALLIAKADGDPAVIARAEAAADDLLGRILEP